MALPPDSDDPRDTPAPDALATFNPAPGGDLVLRPGDRERLRDLWHDARAESTTRAYKTDWAIWQAWCSATGNAELPAKPAAVALYLLDLADKYKFGTIQRKLAAIAWVHKRTRHENPAVTVEVREAIAALARRLGTAPQKKRAIDLALLRRMVALLPETPSGLRDRSLLLTGFFGAFRRSEFTDLRQEQLGWDSRGVTVKLGRTKTDQGGEGYLVPLAARPEEPTMCPVQALQTLIKRVGPNADGYLYYGYFPDGTTVRGGHVDDKHVVRVIKGLLEKLDVDASGYAAHSLRAGFVTQALRDGATIAEVAAVTRHRTVEILLGYKREDDPFTGSAANIIGRKQQPIPDGVPGKLKRSPEEIPWPTLLDLFTGPAVRAAAVQAVALPSPVKVPWDCEPAVLHLYQRAFAWFIAAQAETAVHTAADGSEHPGSLDTVVLIGKPTSEQAQEWLDAGIRILLIPGRPHQTWVGFVITPME